MNITLEHTSNGTVASSMVTDSAGSYRHHKLYQGYSDVIVKEVFAKEVLRLSSY